MSEEEVLKRLAEIRSNVEELRKYHSEEWIMREVLASMALSSEAAQHLRALDLPCTCARFANGYKVNPLSKCSGCFKSENQ